MRITPFTFESLTGEESATPAAILADGTAAIPAEEAREETPPPPTFSEEELAQAKSESHDEGFLAGKKEGIREAEKEQQEKLDELNSVITKVEQQLQQMQLQYEETLTRQQSDISKLVMACAQRLAGEALRKDPISDISEMIENCLSGLFDTPEVQIKVHPDLISTLENKLPKNASLQSDANMNLHDCQINWPHGQATRDSESIWRELDGMIQRHFAAPVSEKKSAESIPIETPPPTTTPEPASGPAEEKPMTNQGENHE